MGEHHRPTQLLLKTRNITVDGRRTSVRLEPEYWRALDAIAAATGRDISQIYAAAEPRHGRADTLRVAVLRYVSASPVKNAGK